MRVHSGYQSTTVSQAGNMNFKEVNNFLYQMGLLRNRVANVTNVYHSHVLKNNNSLACIQRMLSYYFVCQLFFVARTYIVVLAIVVIIPSAEQRSALQVFVM